MTADPAPIRFLDPDGKPLGQLPPLAHDHDALRAAYRAMVLTRVFDTRAIALQRTGQLGTYPSSLGQEAVAVGVARAMEANDVLLPAFREHGAQLVRGVTLAELFLYWGGDERGNDFRGPVQDFPNAIPVGTHAPHAVGVALALKLEGGGHAAVAVLGDGATSKGEVHEAMNLTGVWELPVVFVVNNNQWAISVPRARQSACRSLVDKAVGAGIPGMQVDGNDLIAVQSVMADALDGARRRQRPCLVEALTYRLSDHTTADDASRYRADAEVSRHWREDPVARLRTFLADSDAWSSADEEALLRDCREQVEQAVAEYLVTAPQPVEAMFDYLHETLPADLREQRAALCQGGSSHD